MKIVDHLSNTQLFKGVTQSQIEELAMILTDQSFRRGEIIFSEGDEGVGFYLLVSGQIKIFKLSPTGKEQILHIFGPGEPFAEAAVFAGARFPAHALALQKSRVFFFPRQAFIELIQNNPSLAMNMMAALSMRLKKFAHMIEDLSLKEVPSRLATHILLLGEQQEAHNTTINLHMTKNHLASLLGTIPETMSRILKKMTEHGLIESTGKTIKILDYDGLEDLAAGDTKL